MIIFVDKLYPGQFWQLIWGTWSIDPSLEKFTIVVDGDVDIRDPCQVEWALNWRARPNNDVYIVDNTVPVPLNTATAPTDFPKGYPRRALSSKVVIDAVHHSAIGQTFHPPRASNPIQKSS